MPCLLGPDGLMAYAVRRWASHLVLDNRLRPRLDQGCIKLAANVT